MGDRTILIVGASRGLGLALAAEFAARDWKVIGTVRANTGTGLHDLADAYPGRVEVESLDMNDPEGIAALRTRLSARTLDILFVNAGTTTRDPMANVGAVDVDEFTLVMLTNAYSPMMVIEALHHLVPGNGMIGAMSSGQGSIANNESGTREVYRSSKAALNMFMRSFAARPEQAQRSILLLAPGWIRTDLGGAGAPYTIEESAPLLTDLILAKRERPGVEYLDRFGTIVPW